MYLIIETDTHEWHIDIVTATKAVPAKTWGAVETCYPGEPEELEYTILGCVEFDEDGVPHEVENPSDSEELYALVRESLENLESH